MSDTSEKMVTLQGISAPVMLPAQDIRAVEAMSRSITEVRTFSEMCYDIREPIAVVIALLNAALNPPEPGDVTLEQIQEAMHKLNVATDDAYTLEVAARNHFAIRRLSTQVIEKSYCHTSDILYAIASLMPKPAPDPRDELQANHDAAIALLQHIEPQVEISFEKWDGINAVLKRAENLKGKP